MKVDEQVGAPAIGSRLRLKGQVLPLRDLKAVLDAIRARRRAPASRHTPGCEARGEDGW